MKKTILLVLAAAFLSMGVSECEPTVKPAPGVTQVVGVETEAIAFINQQRAAAGVRLLAWNFGLTMAAQSLSNDMANNNLMFHGVGRPVARHWRWWGEAVAVGYQTPEAAVNGWMSSPAHKEILLTTKATHVGVAASQGVDGTFYWTMMVAS
jgi:uncharacterized protein YkwD